MHQDFFIFITDLFVVFCFDENFDDLEINVRAPSGQEPDCLQLRLPGLPQRGSLAVEFVEPGVEFDNLLDCPGGGLLELASVQDVDEAPGDDGLGGQLQLETILMNTRNSVEFIMFIASSVPLVENYY